MSSSLAVKTTGETLLLLLLLLPLLLLLWPSPATTTKTTRALPNSRAWSSPPGYASKRTEERRSKEFSEHNPEASTTRAALLANDSPEKSSKISVLGS